MPAEKDNFINKLVKDPAEPPSLSTLVGWSGASTDKDSIRLYLNLELSSFVDIPKKAIRHSEDTESASPLRRRPRIERRVGSATAANTADMPPLYATLRGNYVLYTNDLLH